MCGHRMPAHGAYRVLVRSIEHACLHDHGRTVAAQLGLQGGQVAAVVVAHVEGAYTVACILVGRGPSDALLLPRQPRAAECAVGRTGELQPGARVSRQRRCAPRREGRKRTGDDGNLALQPPAMVSPSRLSVWRRKRAPYTGQPSLGPSAELAAAGLGARPPVLVGHLRPLHWRCGELIESNRIE